MKGEILQIPQHGEYFQTLIKAVDTMGDILKNPNAYGLYTKEQFPDAKPLIEALEEMATGKWGYLAQRAATIALKNYKP